MITDYRPLYSIVLLTALGLFIALLDTFLPRKRPAILGWLTSVGVAIALVLDFTGPDQRPWQGLIVFDGFSRSFNVVFLGTLLVVAIGSNSIEPRMRFAGEYYALLIFSTIGLMLMASAGGLIALYIGLELSTICLFALVGFAKRERNSAEAAMKMFILGAVASAIILYGASIIYGVMASSAGASGSTRFDAISSVLRTAGGDYPWALWLGLALVMSGLGFKISAVPFHLWAPDVYEGAPTTVSAYLSTASKAGGFAAVMRFLMVAFPDAGDRWGLMIVVLAALSMVLGNLVALSQTSLKRLLAYSGIAQAGYVLVALTAGGNSENARSSAMFYLLLYLFTNVGGFLIAQAVQDATGSDKITALRGLHKRSPLLAFSMLIVLFSLGGIPPLAGFVGKVYLFAAGWQGGQHALVIIGALISVVALYYYLMVALQVYIRDPEDDRRMPVSGPLGLAIGICVAATLAIGIYPRPWIDLGYSAAAAMNRLPQSVTASTTEPVPSSLPRSN